MNTLLQILGLGVGLAALQEAFRRGGRRATWTMFLVLPAVLTPWWLSLDNSRWGFFPWVKLWSVLLTACWIAWRRFQSPLRRPRALPEISLILAVNILEAVMQDLLIGRTANLLNAAAGVLLVITIRYEHSAVIGGERRDLWLRSTSRGWIAAYTIWNLTFVLLHFPNIAGLQLAVLLAAFGVGMTDPRLWGQARVCTLGASLMLVFTMPQVRTGWLDATDWLSESALWTLAATSLGATALVTAARLPELLRGPTRTARRTPQLAVC